MFALFCSMFHPKIHEREHVQSSYRVEFERDYIIIRIENEQIHLEALFRAIRLFSRQ